ncbi:MAG: Imm32 family immunity protein [Pseudomonadota bacterium]
MTFTVEIADAKELSTNKHRVEIYLDKNNLESLITRLKRLSKETVGEHIHLMSESWGLGDLDEKTHLSENVITHHLKIILAE